LRRLLSITFDTIVIVFWPFHRPADMKHR
jgi:hypothetical protein